jgi:hypothetical protein
MGILSVALRAVKSTITRLVSIPATAFQAKGGCFLFLQGAMALFQMLRKSPYFQYSPNLPRKPR